MDVIKKDNERDNRMIAMMNDASLCPVLEESKVAFLIIRSFR